MNTCYYNIIDENWYTVDDDGFVWGIGATVEESISNAEELGLNCTDITIEEL